VKPACWIQGVPIRGLGRLPESTAWHIINNNPPLQRLSSSTPSSLLFYPALTIRTYKTPWGDY